MKDKKYRDSLKGAVQMLRDMSTLKLTETPTGRPDPQVDGVWQIDLEPMWNDGSDCAIVYLMGYSDPWGHPRETNDFEMGVKTTPNRG